MLAPTLTTHTDTQNHHLRVSISGPLATNQHGAALQVTCLPLPHGYGLVVDLSQVTFITDTGVDGLKTLASTAKSAGNPVAFVCSELIMRAELVLADLDLLAPVLQAPEQALALVGRAA